MRKRFVSCLVAMLIIMSFTGCSGSKKSVENGKFVITKEDLLYRVNQSIEDNGNQYPKFEEFQKPKYIETNGLYSADASLGLKMNVQYDHNETCIESIAEMRKQLPVYNIAYDQILDQYRDMIAHIRHMRRKRSSRMTYAVALTIAALLLLTLLI